MQVKLMQGKLVIMLIEFQYSEGDFWKEKNLMSDDEYEQAIMDSTMEDDDPQPLNFDRD